MSHPQVFGIVALKGGVGKTTLVSNLGAALNDQFGKKVLLVDANFSTPHLGLHVGIVNPKYNLHPALKDEYSIYEAIYQHPSGFHIIPGKLAPETLDPLKLKEKLDPLREIYDVILIDSSPSLNNEMLATMNASDEIIVVSSPDYPTLSSTLHAVNVARKQNTQIRGLVLNKVRKKSFELGKKDIIGASDTEILASLEDDVKVLSALSKMVPVVSYAPKEKISQEFAKLAASLINEPYKKSTLFSNLKNKLKKKTKKTNGKRSK